MKITRIYEVVPLLASIITSSVQGLTAQHRLQLHILGAISLYAAFKRLDAWESAFQDVRSDEDDLSPPGLLIIEVFELGAYNLYGEFNPVRTQMQFDALRLQFAAAGLDIPAEVKLSGW